MNKYIILVLTMLIVFSENNYAQSSSDLSDKEFAQTVMDAILNNKLDVLKEYQPTLELTRELVGERAKDMTDEQLSQGMLIPLQERFQANVDNIQAEIKEEKIDLEKIVFKDYTIEKMGEGDMTPSAMSIQFTYNDKDESIPISFLKIDGKWCLFEILISTNIFKE